MADTNGDLDLHDLLPDRWLRDGCSSVWLTAYRSALPATAIQEVGIIEMTPARAVLVSGSMSYQAVEIEGSVLDRVEIKPQLRTTPEGVYVLILAPYDYADAAGEEASVRANIAATAGLLSTINGGGLTFEFVFDNIVDLETGQLTGFSPMQKTPVAWGEPRVSPDDFQITSPDHS